MTTPNAMERGERESKCERATMGYLGPRLCCESSPWTRLHGHRPHVASGPRHAAESLEVEVSLLYWKTYQEKNGLQHRRPCLENSLPSPRRSEQRRSAPIRRNIAPKVTRRLVVEKLSFGGGRVSDSGLSQPLMFAVRPSTTPSAL